MADLKISQLSDGGASQATDEYVVARSGANYRIDGASVAAAATSVGTLTSLTVSGDLTVDTSTLKVDSTNNRVGIGTATPGVTFDVSGTARATTFKGNLEQPADLYIGTAGAGFIQFYTNNTNRMLLDTSGNLAVDTNVLYVDAVNNRVGIKQASPSHPFQIGTTDLILDASGNLGLGVTPSAFSLSGFRSLEVGAVGSGLFAGPADINVLINAYYNSGWKYAGAGRAVRYQMNSGEHRWYNSASGTNAGDALTFTQAMTLDASGNLGVGTTSPGYRLNVNAKNPGNGVVAQFYNDQTSSPNGSFVLVTQFGVADWFIGQPSATNALTFGNGKTSSTAGTEYARITSGGDFLVGGTFGSGVQVFYSNTDGVNSRSGQPAGDTRSLYTGWYSATSTTQGTLSFNVTTNGNVTNTNNSYGQLSDIKTKQDVVDAASQWDDLKAVRVRKFRFKNNPDGPLQIGVVAQEIEAVSPGLICEHPDYEDVEVTDEDGNITTERQATGTVTKSVKYSVLYMKSIKALQEAMARIEALEVEVAALKANA